MRPPDTEFAIYLDRTVGAIGQTCLELAVLCLAVIVILGVLRVPSPAIRRWFWIVVLAKPVIAILLITPGLLFPLVQHAGFGERAAVDRPVVIVAALWVAITVGMLGRVAVGLATMMSIRRTSERQTEGPLFEALTSARARLHIDRDVALFTTTRISSPALSGIIRPRIFFPASLVGALTSNQTELLFLHELAHLRQHDNIILLLQHVTQALFFFHPAIWICSRMLKRETELACDEIVVRTAGSPVRYADSLTRVAEAIRQQGDTPMTAVAVTQSDLTVRVRRLLSGHIGRTPLRSRLIAVLALAIVAILGLPPALAQDGGELPDSRPLGDAALVGTSTASIEERELQDKVQSLFDELIGEDRSIVRVRVEHTADPRKRRQSISRISMALSVDQTKVAPVPGERGFHEVTRSESELARLTELAKAAVGFNEVRGDYVSVQAIEFDKTQQIVAREQAAARERKEFWTDFAGVVVLLVALGLFSRWLTRRNAEGGLLPNDTTTRAALALAIGLFLCLYAADFWEGLNLRALGTIPGVFLLIVGASRLSGHLLPGYRDA